MGDLKALPIVDGTNLIAAFDTISNYWSPKVIGQVNDQYIKIAKTKGFLTWHKHEHEDEMFYIVKGALRLEFEDCVVDLKAGDFYIVPKGKMHNPVADEECWIMLIESVTTKHTGDKIIDKTKPIEDQLIG